MARTAARDCRTDRTRHHEVETTATGCTIDDERARSGMQLASMHVRMNLARRSFSVWLVVVAGFVACSAPRAPSLVRSFPLGSASGGGGDDEVRGRIDHLAFDPATRRLFVACVENGSLEVLDVDHGRRVGSVTSLREPQGVVIVPRDDGAARVFVACGGDGSVRAFDVATLREVGRVVVGEDADNVRWCARTRRVLVGSGTASGGAIVAVDPERFDVVRRTSLPAHAEGFQLDGASARTFVNVPGGKLADADGTIVVADRERGAVAATWPLRGAARNFPLVHVPSHRLVLVGCREPAVLIALDSENGRELARAPCVADADDVFFDAATDRVFVVGGGDGAGPNSGALDVFHVTRNAPLQRLASVPLPAGSRTGLFVADRRVLFVASPAQSWAPARILEFTID